MADDQLDDDPRDAERFDSVRFDDVEAALAAAPHLSPTAEVSEPMPDWAWERLSAALGTEAAARAVATHDNVVPIGSPAPPIVASEPRKFRWVGGLVAASVAILAITIGVRVTGGTSSSGGIVAADAPKIVSTLAATLPATPGAAPAPQAFSAAEAGPSSDAVAGGVLPSGPSPATSPNLRSNTTAPTDPPAKMVIESNTQYTQAGLTGQVKTLLDRLGVHSAREAALMPAQPVQWPVEDGFTSSWKSLSDCLGWLVKSPSPQALVVDRATFEGSDAGVIIVPADQVDASVSPPPTASVTSSLGTMDVWVVNPACRHQVDSILEHLPLVLAP
jgi:hypothetical protein